MNNVHLNVKVLLRKPTFKQLICANKEKLFKYKPGFYGQNIASACFACKNLNFCTTSFFLQKRSFCIHQNLNFFCKSEAVQKFKFLQAFTASLLQKLLQKRNGYVNACHPCVQKPSWCKSFIRMASFHQGSLLQEKKIVSGEISKEPFLDILLTDLEQSSFSLIFKTRALENKESPRQEIMPACLKTSSHLFLKTGLMLIEKSLGSAQSNYFKVSNIFNGNSKSCFVKPFFVGPAFNLGIKQSRQTDHVNACFVCLACKNFNFCTAKLIQKRSFCTHCKNCVLVSTLPRSNSSLRCARVYTPTHSGEKSFHQLRIPEEQAFVRYASQRQSRGKPYLNMFTNHDLLKKQNRQISCSLKIGDYVHSGDKIGYLSETPIVTDESGKILRVSGTQITIQKMQPVLFYSQAEIHVENDEWVKRGTPILTLTHQTLVTGDIVQGIPRIEQLFEASTAAPPGAALQDFGSPSDDNSSKKSSIDDYLRSHHTSNLLPPTCFFMGTRNEDVPEKYLETVQPTSDNTNQIDSNSGEKRYDSTAQSTPEDKPMVLYKTLQSQVRETFRKKWDQFPLPVAVRQSLEEIQQIIVESIQKVYISQGVLIADKHIEIIVRQMTSKAQVFDGGSTGLLLDEILSLQQIENANISTPGQKALYLPVVMGLTRSALSSDSFVSAASFQETTRVLSRDAIAGKTDFLRGLKEKVIIGDLIDAGTGLDTFYIYSLFSKKIFENKFREILNRKVTHKTLKKLVLTVDKPQPSPA